LLPRDHAAFSRRKVKVEEDSSLTKADEEQKKLAGRRQAREKKN
jgi:hypothetical protein